MGSPSVRRGRRLLAAAVVGVTLVTIGLSFIYIALPADDELRTMLGGAAPIVTAHRGLFDGRTGEHPARLSAGHRPPQRPGRSWMCR